MSPDPKNAWNTFTEEIEVTGHQLIDEINRIIAEGNVRKLQIRSEAGDVYLTVPLTAGVVAGGVVVVAAPWLAVIAAVAGLFTKVKLEVLREAAPAAASENAPSDNAQSNGAQSNGTQVPPPSDAAPPAA